MPIGAMLEALLVVGFWSASPALVKLALVDVGPLSLAGIRYASGGLLLLPWVVIHSRHILRRLDRGAWLRLILMGLVAYSIGNPLIFAGLEQLPTTTAAFLLNIIPVATMILGTIFLSERPGRLQLAGMVLAIGGGIVFLGGRMEWGSSRAVALTLLGALALSVFGILGRDFARGDKTDTAVLSSIPLIAGGFGLFLVSPPTGPISRQTWMILLWLAAINSALAYILWNHALKRLQAFEISLIGNLMPMGTALLAPFLAGEVVDGRAWLGMLISLGGVILVGWGAAGRLPRTAPAQEAILLSPVERD
jgi:drug/metabolite transporter (DMT)-like permease